VSRLPGPTTFRALASVVVPESRGLDDAGWAECAAIIARAIADRPPRVQRQLRLFLALVEWTPVLRFGARFTRLDDARRAALLDGLQRAPLLLLRRGLWGVRTLIFMGYYARPEAGRALGYRADARGWDARRGAGA
jgi:hypothetical protein